MKTPITQTVTLILLALGVITLGWGCKAASIATDIAAESGVISEEERDSANRTIEAFRKSAEEMTEEEEYYIGRAVAADIISRYGVVQNRSVTEYLNRVGKAVSLTSSRPEIYNDYHFAILDSDEINAFAAPGGFVFITRGMLKLVPNEEALSMVLGHEIAHVANRHGLEAINKNRLLEAFAVLGNEAGKTLDREEVVKLTKLYEGAVGDIVKTLIESGYSRSQEKDADHQGCEFAANLGYEAGAMLEFLGAMDKAAAGGGGMFETHPPAQDRIATLRPIVKSLGDRGTESSARTTRFQKAMASL
ncbi:MAG: M48 family metalloprotease [Candidatus Eisenbacteria bacterium]|uniref:M48 family metalloprotease n=1 Tax=Eiseniibacteriota bacterium TaxID=2212470 RepID=A0A7Y2H3V4_UNCEI|nr:M48 family metalloprotease [Candidatus Eisenbacteria bacterium]